ncbi:ATP-binding protein [Candidatus Gracilibacteria bacterium]|nr:ATP-binding protein [Candidatus Gracilibacteria bacterium]
METNENTKPTRISILLPTNAYFMSGIRDFTMSFIKNATQFNEQWAYRFQSIVDELCNNAIEYGSTPGQDIKLTLTYKPGDCLEIIVEDTGTAKVKRTAAEVQKIVDEKRKPGYIHTGIRGRGLSNIVSNWSDEVTFKDIPNGGVMVIAKKRLIQEQQSTTSSAVSDPTHLVLPS